MLRLAALGGSRLALNGGARLGASSSISASSALSSRALHWARVAEPLVPAPAIVGSVRLKKKGSHTKHLRATKVTVHGELDEEAGEFAGKVNTIHGKLFEVALDLVWDEPIVGVAEGDEITLRELHAAVPGGAGAAMILADDIDAR